MGNRLTAYVVNTGKHPWTAYKLISVAPHSCIINAKPCEQSINYDGLSINWKPIGLHQTQSFGGDALIGVNKTNNESFGLSRIHQRLIGSKRRRVQLSILIPG